MQNSSNVLVKNIEMNQQPELNKKQQLRPISCFEIFRFADNYDYALMFVGTVAAAALGGSLPMFSVLWGSITDSFMKGGQQMVDAARGIFYQFLQIGAGVFFAGVLMFACWMIAGERQSIKCRKEYLKSLLRQQIGWFDLINQSELSSRFSTDCLAYQGAIGEKVSTIIMNVGTFTSGFIIAFVRGWQMALVMISVLPLLGLAGYCFMMAVRKGDNQLQKDYSEAGGKAQQAIGSIKTVKMLNGELFESQSYLRSIQNGTKNVFKIGLLKGLGMGALFSVMLGSYGLGFWWGSTLVERQVTGGVSNRRYTVGTVLVVFFSIVIAGFNATNLSPSLEKITQGRAAAARIFKIIDKQPLIVNSPNAITPTNFKGVIRFENVSFSYPKDKNRLILDNLTMEFDSNSSAIVGESGCGKSTIFQLMMRFYDPDRGRITLDGVNIRDIDLRWLRDSIGYVGQQPVLFATTIRENLRFGKDDATQEDIIAALKSAQVDKFVNELEDKLDTYVGYGGGQLSGGQKQRIAIARALLRKPKILLLDEATSALDRINEKKIQQTLDKILKNSTSITIAHRVKTIMNSHIIYVMDKGKVTQAGKFQQLSRYTKYQSEIEQEQEEDIDEKKLTKTLIQQKMKLVDGKNILISKEEREKQEQQQITNKYQKQIFGRIFRYAKDRIVLFILGICAALGTGVVFPYFSVILASMITTIINFEKNVQQSRKDANMNAIYFAILGASMLIGITLQNCIFTVMGASITNKLRKETYEKILKMPISWFDRPRNNAGALTSRLSSDCKEVNAYVTTNLGVILQSVSTLLSGVIIGLVYQWRVALVAIGLIPIMILAGSIKMKVALGFSGQTDEAYKDSSNLITEAMVNIRTVTSFGYDTFVMMQYSNKLLKPYELGIKKGVISGLLFGISQFLMFMIFGLLFFIGAIIVYNFYHGSSNGVLNMFTAIFAILFSAITVGNNAHFMSDIASAKNSAANLFLIQDDQDEEQIQVREKSKMITTGIDGDISIEHISFRYDSRNEDLFNDFSMKVIQGQKVGLVGASGCGKSTIFQLLLRFYEPYQGKIIINNIDIKDFDIHYLRGTFGVVSQQPVLFNQTFTNNIKYNVEATFQEVYEAAKQADAINFIVSNQNMEKDNKEISKNNEGFNRNVGVKGSHISGGQKQRVAIARSVLRKPKILLLDEATSALDSVNEKKVQQSLDKIMVGKTTIAIAHRIETIRNSDEIFVFQKGKIVQQGIYQDLIKKKGYFYNLQRGTQFK